MAYNRTNAGRVFGSSGTILVTDDIEYLFSGELGVSMDENRFNLALRDFLKEAGVTSQREVEKLVREISMEKGVLHLRMVLTSPDAPALNHVVEQTIPLT
jgi:hypothetical protein